MKIYCDKRSKTLESFVGKDVWVRVYISKKRIYSHGRILKGPNDFFAKIRAKSPIPDRVTKEYNYCLNAINPSDLFIANSYNMQDIYFITLDSYYDYVIPESDIFLIPSIETLTDAEIRDLLIKNSEVLK